MSLKVRKRLKVLTVIIYAGVFPLTLFAALEISTLIFLHYSGENSRLHGYTIGLASIASAQMSVGFIKGLVALIKA